MEDRTMKKKYEKPSFRVVELQHRTLLLQGSQPDAPEHNDWLQVKEDATYNDLDDDWE